MLVFSQAMNEAPDTAKEYVERHFLPTTFIGMDCLIAFRTGGSVNPRAYLEQKKPRAVGVAPSHGVDLACYNREDLPVEKRLNTWIAAMTKKGWILTFSSSWDDGCAGSVFED